MNEEKEMSVINHISRAEDFIYENSDGIVEGWSSRTDSDTVTSQWEGINSEKDITLCHVSNILTQEELNRDGDTEASHVVCTPNHIAYLLKYNFEPNDDYDFDDDEFICPDCIAHPDYKDIIAMAMLVML